MDDQALAMGEQGAPLVSVELRGGLQLFLLPLLAMLDAQIDRRLVRTLLASVEANLAFRQRAHGLLLSELGPTWRGRPVRPGNSPAARAPGGHANSGMAGGAVGGRPVCWPCPSPIRPVPTPSG